uniref:Uncharacterized protein n=1 Tax=Anopheles melas TaxID=34690 RepID=A0A182UFY3_9DIPT
MTCVVGGPSWSGLKISWNEMPDTGTSLSVSSPFGPLPRIVLGAVLVAGPVAPPTPPPLTVSSGPGFPPEQDRGGDLERLQRASLVAVVVVAAGATGPPGPVVPRLLLPTGTYVRKVF